MKTPYAFMFLGMMAIVSTAADARKLNSLVGDRAALLLRLLAHSLYPAHPLQLRFVHPVLLGSVLSDPFCLLCRLVATALPLHMAMDMPQLTTHQLPTIPQLLTTHQSHTTHQLLSHLRLHPCLLLLLLLLPSLAQAPHLLLIQPSQ